MGVHKSLLRALLLSTLVSGCLLEDDTQVGNAKAAGNGGDNQSANGNAQDSPDDDDNGNNGVGGGNTGTPTPEDAAVEDSGPQGGEMDAGVDAGTTPLDAGTTPPDAGTMPPDAGPSNTERAKLIYDHVIAEGYVQNWFPFLQSTGDQRPLVASGGHGKQVRVRQNSIAKAAVEAWVAAGRVGPLVMPKGSIIVKEAYALVVVPVTDPPTPPTYTLSDIRIMAKLSEPDPVTFKDNWFYVKVPSTNIPEAATTCTDCHNGRTNRGIWPKKPAAGGIPEDPGGKVDGLILYDYLVVPFCSDPTNVALCKPPA